MTWKDIVKNLPKDEKYDGGDPSENMPTPTKEDFRKIMDGVKFTEIFDRTGANTAGLMKAGQKFVNELAELTSKVEPFGKEGEREQMYRVEGDRKDETMIEDNEEYISNIVSQVLMSAYSMQDIPAGSRKTQEELEEEDKNLDEEILNITKEMLNQEVSPFTDATSRANAEDLFDEVENTLLEVFGDEADDQILEFMENPVTRNFISYVEGLVRVARTLEYKMFEEADERPEPTPTVRVDMDDRQDFSQEFKDMNKSWEFILRK